MAVTHVSQVGNSDASGSTRQCHFALVSVQSNASKRSNSEVASSSSTSWAMVTTGAMASAALSVRKS